MGHGKELRLGSIINGMEIYRLIVLIVLLLVQRYGLCSAFSMGVGVHSQHRGGSSGEVTFFK